MLELSQAGLEHLEKIETAERTVRPSFVKGLEPSGQLRKCMKICLKKNSFVLLRGGCQRF